jgi:membrane associated rhomboid family serine protease
VAQTCYRHPNRETGVSCSNCGRPICPECMTSTPVGMRCPECARDRTRVRFGAGALSGSEPYATYVLIGINVAVFLAELVSGAGATTIGTGDTLITKGGLLGSSIADQGEWYRIVSAGFLHAGLFHIGLNMFVLYILGRILEPAIGTPRFVALYGVSLLAGSCGALLLTPDQLTVGASGAIYGVMGATIVIARGRGLENIAGEIGIWLVLNLVLSFSLNGISIGGHIGGLIGGTLCALLISWAERRRAPNAAAIEALGMLAIAAASVAGSFWAAGQSSGVL